LLFLLPVSVAEAVCTPSLSGDSFIQHDLANSYCELCGVGEVRIRVRNPRGNNDDMSDIVVTEDLGVTGLTYVPGSTSFVGFNVAPPAPFEPVVSGVNGRTLTWTFPPGFVLEGSSGMGNQEEIEIRFQVRRHASLDEEGLVSVNRNVTASVEFTPSCEPTIPHTDSDTDELPIRQAVPFVTKQGRNRDAGQGGYSDPVYGHFGDDVLWRLRVENRGQAGMQDLRLDDSMLPADNFDVNYACPTTASALAVADANGTAPGGSPCVPIAPGNLLPDFAVDDPFGNPGNDQPGAFVDAPAGSQADIFLVGKIISNCVGPRTNTVTDVQWGCEVDAPDGGITVPATTGGSLPSFRTTDSAVLSNVSTPSGLTVQALVTGTNTAQPVGSKGTVRLVIRNQSGSTVKNLKLRDILPVQYVVDSTFTPIVSMAPAYGNSYPGMTDNIVWTNPAPNTFPLTSTNPAEPLSNTAPEFTLTSTGCSAGPCGTADVHPFYPDQFNLMRHGDVLTVTFRIVLIRPQSYDLVANLDVREEMPASDPPGTDPTHVTTLSNQVFTEFEEFCNPGVIRNPSTNPRVDNNIPADPEDLDVDIVGSELIFILTNNPNQRLPLTVQLANRGGHDARDWETYVTFGESMSVVTVPSGCSATTNPPLLPPWRDPSDLPASASVYRCTQAVLGDGATRLWTFEVIKNSAAGVDDDLTFRADVIGEIVLSNGTRLWFPAPVARADGVLDRANNYSLDGIRARVIGFNLLKAQDGDCTENNPPPGSPDQFVQIGEECRFHIESGGWFGFQTPGFVYIAVQDIQVVDEMPDGQGWLRASDPYAESTSAIMGVTLNPAGLSPLDEGWIDWRFNRVIPGERITVKDHWFRVDTESRLLNDPIDTVAAPNQHAALSTNVLNAYFQAVYMNENLMPPQEEIYNLGPNTVGYPRALERTVSLTVTEPRILVVKEVCNETLYGVGPACGNFVPLADDGDARNTYVYRVTLTNEAASSGVTRAPAYDVITTDVLDPSDLAFVVPFNGDGLDNDGDGLVDGGDAAGEGAISDNVVKNAVPATVTFSHTHSDVLLRLDAGQSVTLYYRVDFDDDAAPQQQFVNSVTASYDSLENAFGNQTAPQRPNSDIGGARVYTSPAATSTVEIIPVVTEPKAITRLSNTAITGSAPQPVAIGEEVEYELVVSLPVALLRNFVVRDELPAGMRCVEAPVVDLDAPPYAAAGFSPGGSFTPTCADDLVEWNFGDQRVTQGTVNNRYDFAIRFIARVDNTAGNNEGDVLRNGGASTSVTASYVDQNGAPVTLTIGEASIVVREPVIALTKAFSVANADASDVLTVTVTATNTGTITAYNLRVLDDLAAVANLTYLGNVSGLDPPDNVDTVTLGANRPIFSWNPANPDFAIAPGATRSFTFEVRVEPGVQPQEILDNTLEASWTSLPGQTTALNGTGLIGADGSDTGLRNGALPNLGDPINDYETTATAAATVPALSVSKTDLSPAVIPTIGAYKQFQIEILLPEGVSNNVSVSDALDASGITYALAHNATYDITYTFVGIASINGQAPDESAFGPLPAVPTDNTTGTAVWNIGTVVTDTENDTATNAITPAIRISYYARVNNDLTTDAGDVLQNVVTVSYTHGETGLTQTVSATAPAITVVEPLLTLAKTVSNITSPGDAPVVGDTLEYQVILTNAGTSTAFDLNIVDTLPAGVVRNTGFTPTVTINGVPLATFDPTPGGDTAGPLNWGRGIGDDDLDIPVGETLILTYRVTVQAIPDPGGLIENGVTADWTSLDDASPDERTGDGCPTITAPNDYCVGPVTATTTGIRPLRFEKTVFNVTTGQSQPASPALLSASPGDELRYTVRIQNISNRPVANLRVADELDRLNASPMFVAGSLVLDSVTGSGFTNNTNPTGGTNGTGLVDLSDLSVAAAGGADTVTIVFRATLVPVIPNGTVVPDQAQIFANGELLAVSDDPILNGVENPGIIGDEDPTSVQIASAPFFDVRKTSDDLTGDPAILNPGDTLRYTITIKNIGTEHATGATFRDLIPANTTYVPGSATLNGAPVPDPSPGVSPFESNFPINAPEDPTPGAMRADAGPTTDNVATVTFDVVINANVANGTVISNQGFVNGFGTDGSGNPDPAPEEPSDDPATPAINDPTLDVVGDAPFIYTIKTAALQVDGGTPGQVDPGDVLRYTFTITNFGALPATGVTLTDNLPNDTTYVANSFQLNGIPILGPFPPLPPGGVAISSSDLTPPLPLPGAGTLSPGGTAVAIFDAQVNAGTPDGTIISNQGTVESNELGPQLTDADGNPGNGYQPTQVVVGDAQRLTITKQVAVVGGGPAIVGAVLEYVVQVRNISTVAVDSVVITDVLPISPQFTLSYVAGSGTLNGAAAGVTMTASDITADYGATYGDLPAGGIAELRYRVTIDSGTTGATITNTATVTWDAANPQSASASVSIVIGAVVGNALLTGTAWHDADFDNLLDPPELSLAGWSVQVFRYNTSPASAPVQIGATVTDANGVYQLVVPSNGGTTFRYQLRFSAPGAGASTAKLGLANSEFSVPVPPPAVPRVFTDELQQISDIEVDIAYVPDLNLPIDPDGVVYNAVLRTPVAGTVLTLLSMPGQAALPPGCFDDPAQQGQVTLGSGYYKFDLNFSDAACPPGADYLIRVTPPGTAFDTPPSALVPPASSATTPAYSVPLCSADAIAPAPPTGYCEAVVSEFAPPVSVPAPSPATTYYLHVTLDDSPAPNDSQLFNNHIPLDPELATALTVSKTTPLTNVTRGQLVPYTITVRNLLQGAIPNLTVIDSLPPGFKYIENSAQLDGVASEPTLVGRDLRWDNLTLAGETTYTFKLLLVVGAGVGEGEYVNRVRVVASGAPGNSSAEATATVRVVPDPTFDCTDVIGKVFDDANANGHQDPDEPGLAGVRVVSARGLIARTDQYGRYHITCAVVPNEDRGSNYILKLDDRSLPSGYRLTTANPLVKRATRGKMIKFNFGAALHRVVRLDIANAVFEPGTVELRPQWKPRIDLLLAELRKAPSVLRISYLGDVEGERLVTRRLNVIKQMLADRWKADNRSYALTIETEIYWRRGAPPKRKAISHD